MKIEKSCEECLYKRQADLALEIPDPETRKDIFFLFLCKCDLFIRRFNVPKLTGMFVYSH